VTRKLNAKTMINSWWILTSASKKKKQKTKNSDHKFQNMRQSSMALRRISRLTMSWTIKK